MRITLDVISQAPQSMNPNKERMISLRGLKIAVIENLGATTDNFECIDLCDNDLTKLANFPPLKKLTSLLLANNRLSRIDLDVFESLPNLVSLVLTNNKMESLGECRALCKAKRLERLTLMNNPVSSNMHFRPFIIHIVPSLRFLNFIKIRPKDREEANSMFSGKDGEKLKAELVAQGGGALPGESSSSDKLMTIKSRQLSAEHQALVKVAISKAQTLEEVARLEGALKSGVLPADILRENAAPSSSMPNLPYPPHPLPQHPLPQMPRPPIPGGILAPSPIGGASLPMAPALPSPGTANVLPPMMMRPPPPPPPPERPKWG